MQALPISALAPDVSHCLCIGRAHLQWPSVASVPSRAQPWVPTNVWPFSTPEYCHFKGSMVNQTVCVLARAHLAPVGKWPPNGTTMLATIFNSTHVIIGHT